MFQLLNGRIVRDKIAQKLTKEISRLALRPTLAIIQIGDLKESSAYIRQKKIFAEKIGAKVVHTQFVAGVSKAELLSEIARLNADQDVHGIIVQLPIPENFNEREILETMSPLKDVDGMTSVNFHLLALNSPRGFVDPTVKGILSLLHFYGHSLNGERVVVIGRSMLVGKPMALAALNLDATVTVAHSKTKKLKELSRSADILIVAIGQPCFVNHEYVSPGQIIIDVCINFETVSTRQKIVGDVDFEKVKNIVKAITPVPGGVGPLTVAALFENLLDASTSGRKGNA